MKNKLVTVVMIVTCKPSTWGRWESIARVLQGQLNTYSKAIGLDDTTLNLSVFDLTFGIHFQLNVAQIILLVVALFVSPKIANAIQT